MESNQEELLAKLEHLERERIRLYNHIIYLETSIRTFHILEPDLGVVYEGILITKPGDTFILPPGVPPLPQL